MTKVNWERLGGDNVEEFVAALILLRNPTGNRITPSQGDRGVDVQVKLHSGSYDFYQIKRFTGPLTNAQKRQVEKSWSSFLAQTATTHQVASWNVVMPYDPTPQNLDWVRSITAPGNIAVNWLGRTQLDSWAAENPRLVDYYFGDGRTRTEQVFSRLLQIQQGLHPTSEEDGDLVLKSLAKASAAIHASLNEIDPFYRYEMQCRHGSLDSLMREMRLGPSKDVAFSSFAQPTGSDTCIITHVIPRCRESVTLRPISFGVTLNAESGTDEHQALCRYYEFGLPPQAIKGTVSGYNGPPGGPPDGEGVVSLFETDFQDDTLPLLEVNVRTTGADPLSVTVPISDVHRGASPVGRGGYLAFSDVTHAFRMTLLMLSTGGLKGVEIERSSLAGRRPTESVISYRFLAALVRGGTITLQVRNGGLNLVQFELEAQQDRSRVEAVLLMRDYIESLAEIQRHVLTSIEIPDTEFVSHHEVQQAVRCARLLRGEKLAEAWSHLDMHLGSPEAIQQELEQSSTDRALLCSQPLMVKVGEQILDTGHLVWTVYKGARFADESRRTNYAVGDTVRLIPSEDDEAIVFAAATDSLPEVVL